MRELERARKEVAERRKAEAAKAREERETMENAIKMQRKEDERRRRMEARKEEYEMSLRRARKNYQVSAIRWANLSRDPNVAYVLGILFLGIFYRTVVYNYKRRIILRLLRSLCSLVRV